MDTSADQSADGRWLSYAELADLRGIDNHSARRLTSRLKWPRRKANDGTIRILVPLKHLQPPRRHLAASASTPADMSAVTPAASADRPADISAVIIPFEAAITALREQLTAADDRLEAAEARAVSAETGRRQAEQSLAGERTRADALRDRVDALTGELRASQETAIKTRQSVVHTTSGGWNATLFVDANNHDATPVPDGTRRPMSFTST